MFMEDSSKRVVTVRLALTAVFALALLGCMGCVQLTGGAYDSPSASESAQADTQKPAENDQDVESGSANEEETKSPTAELPSDEIEVITGDNELDAKLNAIKSEAKAASSDLESKFNEVNAAVGETYQGYVDNTSRVQDAYDFALERSDALYESIVVGMTDYYALVREKGVNDYKTWSRAMEDGYGVWDEAMKDYYEAWDRLLKDSYEQYDEAINSGYETEEYKVVSDTWTDMYRAYDDSWTDQYRAYDDNWSKLYRLYDDSWSEMYRDSVG